jgi:hypothetical protein
MPSTAAQVIITVIPIVGIVMGGIVLFFFFYWQYKEKMLIIEKGQFQKNEFDLNSLSLFSGLVLTSIGVCLVVFFVILEGFSYSALSGLIPLSLGASLLIFFVVRMNMNKNGKKE